MTGARGGRATAGPPGRRPHRPGGPEPPTGAGPAAPDLPPRPDPLAVPVTDTHTHLDMQDGDVDAAIASAAAVGVTTLVQVGVDVPSSQWAGDIAVAHTPVWATVALHPNEAPRIVHGDTDGWSGRRRAPGGPDALDRALAEIDRLAALPQVRGIGETGLDYFRTSDEGRPTQHHSFRRHIEIAKWHRKPLVIHDRDAHDDVFRMLDEEGAPGTVVFHCFSGDAAMAKACGERGYYLSFAGNVTFANAEPLREALAAASMDLVLVETDAPFLTPVPYRGRPNASYLVPWTVRKMAEVKAVDEVDMARALGANAERVFGPF
jgi:TatD DNase family protein